MRVRGDGLWTAGGALGARAIAAGLARAGRVARTGSGVALARVSPCDRGRGAALAAFEDRACAPFPSPTAVFRGVLGGTVAAPMTRGAWGFDPWTAPASAAFALTEGAGEALSRAAERGGVLACGLLAVIAGLWAAAWCGFDGAAGWDAAFGPPVM